MSDETDQSDIADLEAFEARFPPEVFAGVAEALRLPPEPETLSWLRCLLLPEFRFFVALCPGEKLSRDERIARLEKLRDAATALLASLRPARSLLPRKYLGPELLSDQFRATVRSLADETARQLQRQHSSRGPAGRPAKSAFRQLTADLARVYKCVTGKDATRPDWKGGSKYGGKFYEFVAAVEQCLRSVFTDPEVLDQLPDTQAAIGDGLRKNWGEIQKLAGENRSKLRPNKPGIVELPFRPLTLLESGTVE
jgi:hypothetical protein